MYPFDAEDDEDKVEEDDDSVGVVCDDVSIDTRFFRAVEDDKDDLTKREERSGSNFSSTVKSSRLLFSHRDDGDKLYRGFCCESSKSDVVSFEVGVVVKVVENDSGDGKPPVILYG